MPLRYVQVPGPIQVKEGAEKVGEPMKFADFIKLVTNNPIWAASYAAIKSMQAIEKALASSNGVMELAEEDWTRLKGAIETPQSTDAAGRSIPGYGIHTRFLPQLVPFMDAIMDAKTEPPPKETA